MYRVNATSYLIKGNAILRNACSTGLLACMEGGNFGFLDKTILGSLRLEIEFSLIETHQGFLMLSKVLNSLLVIGYGPENSMCCARSGCVRMA